MSAQKSIAVLGAGSWGATLANLLAEKSHSVSLWEFDPAAAKSLASTRLLPVLPALKLNTGIDVTSNIRDALKDRTVIISVTPSHFVRSTMKSARASGAVAPDTMVISASKGLEEKTLKRMSEVIAEELTLSARRIVVLAGPSHAEEVCRHLPSATVVAGLEASVAADAQSLLTQDYFRVYSQGDVLGVELASTFKNVYAIACGVSDGLGFGDNARAAILTRGLNEMARIGVKMGAQMLTFFGLAGMGDLIVTGLSRHSRNHQLGEKIGQGQTPQQALAEMTMVAEGWRTTPSVYAIVERLALDCPLIRELYQILYENKNPRTSLRDLMSRETESEWHSLLKGESHEQSKIH